MVLAFRLIHMRSLNGFGETGEICSNRMGPHYSIVSCLLKHLTKKLNLKTLRDVSIYHTPLSRGMLNFKHYCLESASQL